MVKTTDLGGRRAGPPGRRLGPKARQRQLFEVEQRLVYALRAAEVGIFDWDVARGRTIYIDPYGDPERPSYLELPNEESARLVHPEDRESHRTTLERFIRGGEDAFELTHRRHSFAKNAWRHVQVRGRVVARDGEGRPARVLGIFRDVTESLAATQAAHERELAVANASRLASIGEMAAVLGHELNQPLAALTTYVQALARLVELNQTSHAEMVRALRRCVDLAERASGILQRVRGLVRRSPVAEATFDLREAAAAVVELLHKPAREAGATLRVRRPRQPVLVTADRLQVEQALFNLARNAIESLAESRRRPRAVTLAVASSDGHALATVADNGRGIPPARVGKLFEPFYTTKPGGSGLGLAIARSIAEAQGGGLRLERNGPGGATFALSLPGERRRPRGAKA